MSAPMWQKSSTAFVRVSNEPAWVRFDAIEAVYPDDDGQTLVAFAGGQLLVADCPVDEFMQRITGGGQS